MYSNKKGYIFNDFSVIDAQKYYFCRNLLYLQNIND